MRWINFDSACRPRTKLFHIHRADCRFIKASIYSSISGGINALWGPLHGGANQEVILMLEQIKKDGGDTDKWIAKAKDKTIHSV